MSLYSENRFSNLAYPIEESVEDIEKDNKDEEEVTLESLTYSKQIDLLDSFLR